MQIQLSGVVNDSIVDGTGIRLTVFTQGCPHHCPLCHNPQTHDFSGGYTGDTESIISVFLENPLLDGITLSGGEPLAQPIPCAHLAEEAQKAGLNVWLYTGYAWEDIFEENNPSILHLLTHTNVMIDGVFLAEARSLDLVFRGSTNQRIIDVQQSLKTGTVVLWEL